MIYKISDGRIFTIPPPIPIPLYINVLHFANIDIQCFTTIENRLDEIKEVAGIDSFCNLDVYAIDYAYCYSGGQNYKNKKTNRHIFSTVGPKIMRIL